MTIEPTPTTNSLIARVKGILLKPNLEWPIIDAEPATVKGLFTGYAMILAAIGPVASFIGTLLFFRAGIVGALLGSILAYVMTLAGTYALGLIIDALAPSFGGQKNPVQAMKVAVYSATAGWVGGVFNLIPMLSVIGVLFALYGLYILYLGLPRLMRAPQDKALGYTAVVVIIAIVIFVVIGAVVGAIIASMAMAGAAASGAYAYP